MAQTNHSPKRSFVRRYFNNAPSLIMLVVVCTLIAVIINLVNRLGLLTNLGFSFGFGVSITLIETLLRTHRAHWSEFKINSIAVFAGSLIGTGVIYSYLVRHNIITLGEFDGLLLVNFAWGGLFSSLAFYFFWVRYRNQALTLALREQQLKTAESENLHQQAEYRLLQSQMEPHFLFNTLANIQSLIDIDSKAAKTMISDLSRMLRVTLQNTRQDQCNLAQELELVRAYLGIQQIRLGERLQVIEEIDDSLLNVRVPPMILQPLVENSLRHGVETSTQPSTLWLQIMQQKTTGHGTELVIVIRDDCQPLQRGSSGHGLSLNNIRQRLQHRFGTQASLHSAADAPGWRNELRLPITAQE